MNIEQNKILASVLVALLLAQSATLISEYLVHQRAIGPNIMGLKVTASKAGGGSIGAAKLPDINQLMVKASISKGEAIAKKCIQCHTFNNGGANKTGPNLFGIIGEKIGQLKGGFSFSSAMKNHGGTWTLSILNEFLHNPRKVVSGTKMSFAGLSDAQDRADIIAYLNSNSAQPLKF